MTAEVTADRQADTSASVKAAPPVAEGTEYVILIATGNTTWGEVGRFTARSTDAAIRIYAEKSQTFIAQQENESVKVAAIPARSFKPVTVRTQTVTTLKLEEAK